MVFKKKNIENEKILKESFQNRKIKFLKAKEIFLMEENMILK